MPKRFNNRHPARTYAPIWCVGPEGDLKHPAAASHWPVTAPLGRRRARAAEPDSDSMATLSPGSAELRNAGGRRRRAGAGAAAPRRAGGRRPPGPLGGPAGEIRQAGGVPGCWPRRAPPGPAWAVTASAVSPRVTGPGISGK